MSGAIRIDGRYGEGGGQILRTSLALASLLRRPLEIHHIRGGRKKPGLRPQHLMAVKAMAAITSAKTQGDEPGSTHLFFEPGQIRPGSFRFDVGTAGSTSLVLQTMIPALLFGESASGVVIEGGTHVPWSPCFQYFRAVFASALQEMGGLLTLEIERWGWYPKGGGQVTAGISPVSALHPTERWQRGKVTEIYLLSALSNLPMSIGERQRDQVIKRLDAHGLKNTQMEFVNAPSAGTGALVFLMSRFEKGTAGFTSLGKKGKRAEKVADDACSEFFQFLASDAAVDEHLADQLVLYMALAKGRSSIVTERITKHLKTNIWVVEQFLPVTFQVDEIEGRVSVEGVGFRSTQ
jgi:RNA 3'-terminal phosphate cyclase (ATP)